MITIRNERLTAQIHELGAELKSLVMDGKEYIWGGHPDIWKSSCPLLFPICGGLKDNRYTYKGKEYAMPRHGFGRTKVFTVERVTEDSAVFLLTADDETRAMYPFEFELRVLYTLKERSVEISYQVKNLGEETMYFSIGSHEGYFTPEGVEDYDIWFPEEETLDTYVLCGPLLSENCLPIIKKQKCLPIYEKYFMIDTLVFKNLKSRSALLRNRKTGRGIRVDFPDAKYFMVWHKPGAPFLCLEPWNGVADSVDADGAIETKEGIMTLAPAEEYRNTHSITIQNET